MFNKKSMSTFFVSKNTIYDIFKKGVATRHYWYKKKSHHNFIRVATFVIYYKGGKRVGNEYLCHLTFTIFKFTLKNFIFLEMMYIMVSLNIFFLKIILIVFACFIRTI